MLQGGWIIVTSCGRDGVVCDYGYGGLRVVMVGKKSMKKTGVCFLVLIL